MVQYFFAAPKFATGKNFLGTTGMRFATAWRKMPSSWTWSGRAAASTLDETNACMTFQWRPLQKVLGKSRRRRQGKVQRPRGRNCPSTPSLGPTTIELVWVSTRYRWARVRGTGEIACSSIGSTSVPTVPALSQIHRVAGTTHLGKSKTGSRPGPAAENACTLPFQNTSEP